jgi:hypothetical protein
MQTLPAGAVGALFEPVHAASTPPVSGVSVDEVGQAGEGGGADDVGNRMQGCFWCWRSVAGVGLTSVCSCHGNATVTATGIDAHHQLGS